MEETTPKTFMHIADILVSRGYSLGHEIGAGTYSKVRTAERTTDGRMCAVKIIDKSKVRNDYLNKFMPRELEIICKLKHRNVVRTIEIIQGGRYVFQILQLAEKGDVLRLIQQKGHVTEAQSRQIIKDVATGLSFLHGLNVFHRDLKCENILLCKDNTALISDFGFARTFGKDDKNTICQTFCGSTAYASPELVRGIPYEPRENDVWSVGCIMFTMMCGTMPFDDSNVTRMVRRQMSKSYVFPAKIEGKITQSCKHVIGYLLEPEVERRWNLQRLLASEWVNNV